MAKNNEKKHVENETHAAGIPDPWAAAMGNIPAELLASLTEEDTAAGSTFPPYWSPDMGKAFVAAVVDVDARNPEFVRYTFLAAHDIVCHRGEVDAQEEVTVGPGERFSVSAYFSLPLDEYMNLGNIGIMVTDKIKLKSGNTMWTWKVKCNPTQKAQLSGIRAEKHRAALEAKKGTQGLEDKMFGNKTAQPTATPPVS
jgi:hypothetical protein